MEICQLMKMYLVEQLKHSEQIIKSFLRPSTHEHFKHHLSTTSFLPFARRCQLMNQFAEYLSIKLLWIVGQKWRGNSGMYYVPY